MKPFAIRRAFRILPVFWMACGLGILMLDLSSAISPEKASALTSTDSISLVCVVAKMSAVASLLPLFHPCDFLGNAPLLTVMVEIGLYAFYGFVFFKGGERLVLLACAVSFIIGAAIAIISTRLPNLYNWWQNSSLLAFLPYWWIGAAICVPRVKSFVLRYPIHIISIWLALTAATLFIDPTALISEIRKIVLAMIIGWLILKIDTAEIRDNQIALIGRAGYSVYALHAPISIYLCISGAPWWLNIALTTGCGIVSYYVFERPIDKLGRHLSWKTA